jgi:hypothetical protein
MNSEGPFRVLDASIEGDRQEWLRHWDSWPRREVHAHPSFVSLFAADTGAPMCAVWESGSGSVLFPFVLRSVPTGESTKSNDPATDIVSPYGYGGAFAWDSDDRGLLAHDFWDALRGWALSRGVVSEFVRLTLFPDAVLPFEGSVEVKQDNIVCDLALDETDLWMSFEHKVRKNVNKARRSGVTVETDLTGARLIDFLSIYESTLDRRNARDDYYFDRHFFDRLHQELTGQLAYFHAFHGGEIVSTELVLLSAESAYSFLGGTKSDSFALRPNDLLKYEIMKWAKASGRRWFVLGGGYEPDDGIYRYKKAFAPDGVRPFSVGKRIFNPQRYEQLVQLRNEGTSEPARGGFFPEYRS